MNQAITWKQLIIFIGALLALFYLWSIGTFDFGRHNPPVIYSDPANAIEGVRVN